MQVLSTIFLYVTYQQYTFLQNDWRSTPSDIVCGLERISRIILNHTSEKKSPLANILKHFLQKHSLNISMSSSDEAVLPNDPLSGENPSLYCFLTRESRVNTFLVYNSNKYL